MNQIIKRLRFIPPYAVLPLIWTFIFNMLVYSGSRLFTTGLLHYNIESSLDLKVPFLPWTVSIYLVCYAFWVVNYILAARQGKEAAYRLCCADFTAKCICLLCFVFLPTTNTRPEVLGTDFWAHIMRFVYQIDAPDNLFPSIHCLVSWFCFIGIRGKKNIPLWYRIFSCIFALMVFVSTVTTKQHVLADVIAGAVLAEVCYYLVQKTGFVHVYQRCFEKIYSIKKE